MHNSSSESWKLSNLFEIIMKIYACIDISWQDFQYKRIQYKQYNV